MRIAFPHAAFAAALLLFGTSQADAETKPRPLFRDFAGLCVHTVQFKPDLYRPVVRLVRDYHPFEWDVGEDTSFKPAFPFARNRVDWSKVYGAWKSAGYDASASILFDNLEESKWKDIQADAFAYGKAFGAFFGPSNTGLISATEIGNEPGKYSDESYRALFEAMARGIREGDPRMRIAPCAMNLGESGRYSKSVDLLKGLDHLWDILNVHIYPEVEGWPTWRRSYPEDPKIEFLRHLRHVLKWRRENAPGKELWLTEWGYDSSTKQAPKEGTFVKWVGQTDQEQAMWIVRGFLMLAATDLDRAYLYFFNDQDVPHVHGSSGLTRDFQPKPSFHAVAHLQETLGDYRLSQVHQEDHDTGYIQEWVHGSDTNKRVTVCWYPSGEDREMQVPVDSSGVDRIERMPFGAGPAESVQTAESGSAQVSVRTGPRPVYIHWNVSK